MPNDYRCVHNRFALIEQPTWSPPRADLFRLHGVRNSVLSQLFDRKPTPLSIWGCDVLEEIGRGGMGTVYRAYDPALDRTLAIKLLTLPALDPNQLLAEAQAMARVSHPNVIRVYDAGLFEGHVFIVMEYIPGSSFRTWLSTPRTRAQILEKLVLAGRGLCAIHRSGLIHRDLKPGNILVGTHGEVKIIDFGIAVRDTLAPSESSTGTLAYMSPEQLSGVGVTAKSDQFAFFTTLFEAVTDQHPFAKSTAIATMSQILLGEPCRSRSRLPRWLRVLLKRGLAKNPERRFASMDAVVAAMKRGPIRRRRMFQVIGGTAVVATVLVALATTREVEDPCADVRDKPVGLWDPAIEQELTQQHPSLRSSPRWDPTRKRLQKYVDEWHEERVDACSAHQNRELTTASYAAQNECLEHGKLHVSLIVDRVRHSGELDDDTLQTVDLLPAPARCQGAAEHPESLGNDPLRRYAQAIRKDLQTAKTYMTLGEGNLARDIVEGAYEQVYERVYKRGDDQPPDPDYLPLLAEAQLAKGAISLELQLGDDPTQMLESAFNIATTNKQTQVAQEAASRLIFAYGEVERAPKQALEKENWADIATITHPLDPEGQWLFHLNSGVAADRRGDYFAAQRHSSKALDVSEGTRHAVALYNLAILQAAYGFTADGVETLGRGLRRLRDEYGAIDPFDPTLAFLKGLVDIHLERGDISSAREVITQAYALELRAVLNDTRQGCRPEAIEYAAAPGNLLNFCMARARVGLLEGDPEGLAAGADVLQAVRSFYGEDRLLVAMIELQFEQPQFAVGKEFPELHNNPNEQVGFHHLYALALRNLGNLNAAYAHAKKAVDLTAKLPEQPAPRMATLLLSLGAIALDLGHSDAAREYIEDSHEVLSLVADDNILNARTEIILGRIAAVDQKMNEAVGHFKKAEKKLLEAFPSEEQEDILELRRHRKKLLLQ